MIDLRVTNMSGETPELCQWDPIGKLSDSEVTEVIKDSRERKNSSITVFSRSTNNFKLILNFCYHK